MIGMLNGSLRGEKSNSNYFLDLLEQNVDGACERMHLGAGIDFDSLKAKLREAETLVFAMPLYVDGVPAQVMALIERLYDEKVNLDGKYFYLVSNLGFYESRQAQIQVEIFKNWCEKMHMVYSGALVIGAGEMLGSLRNVPLHQGPNKMLGEGMEKLADAVSNRKCIADFYVEPSGFPRRLYVLAAHMGWKRNAGENGLKKKKDLYRKLSK